MLNKNPQTPHRKSTLLAGIASVLTAFLGTSSAIAEDGADATSFALEEIVVTARKRTENLQEVPISIAVMKGERLNAMFDGGADIRVLATRIPSVYAEGSSGRTAPRFYIRGLGNVDFDLTASQPVSIIMDDVVMENVLLKGFPLFDIEQVEVLRGPQGTLFGRNTPAGIIKFDTKKPTDELDGGISASAGRYGSLMFQGAVGGPISETVSARIATQYNRRSDWINNANDAAPFVSEGNDLGGFEDIAVRGHLLFEPNEDFNALVTLQYRDLTGTTTIFRANVLDAGSNELNSRFDRDVIYYDGGRNNFSNVESFGATLKMNYDLGGVTLTSITSYFDTNSNGIGDIDGGAGAFGVTPNSGFIPFPSETGSLNNDLNQFSQELRLSNEASESFRWQIGAFYFKDDFTVDSAAWNGFGDPSPTIRAITNQENTAWAIFGQGSSDVTEQLAVTVGLRYSDDKKDFSGTRPLGFLGPINAAESVSDNHLSWDVSANYTVNNDTMLYARVANGFRGPSIQGRLLFSNAVTTAKSETVDSFDLGIKSELMDNRVRLNASVFYYQVNDQQFTAIGGAGNFNQLINADKGVGKGFEVDAEIAMTENLLVTMGVSYNNTEIQDENLLIAPCGGGCTTLDPIVVVDGANRANIDGNPFPQAPEWIFAFTASYTIPVNDSGEIFIFTDWAFQGHTNFFLYESEEFYSSGNFEGGLRVGYRDFDSGIEGAFFVRNITDEENLVGGIDFNNLTGFVNEPRIWGFELSYDF